VVGDVSDASEVAKYITKTNLKTDLFNTPTLVTPVIGAATGTSLQLSGLTASEIVITDASKNLASAAVATYPSLTELSYVKGVTSAVQTQINAKAPIASPTFTGTVTVPVGLTGVLRADTGVVSVDTDVTDIVAAGTDLAAGKLELATDAETVTGSDTARATTPANITAKMAAPGAIGGTTPSTGVFTTLTVNTGLIPDAIDGAYLGTTTAQFSDLFLAEGGVINWDNGDVTLTQTGNQLEVAGGDLKIGTLTGVLRGDTGVVSVDTDVTDIVAAASTTAAGKVELTIDTEVTTGTSTTLAVTPDSLAGSTIFGRKTVSIQCFDGGTDVTTGDGKAYLTIPEALNGMNLVRAQATVVTAGTTNATTVMIHNKTDAADMLSGAISIASAGTVGTVGTVNGATDDVATNDVLRIDVDSVSTTAPKGLMVVLEFQLP
jgi:hypothetical protein